MKKSLSIMATLALCSISMPSFAIITTQNSTNATPSKNTKKVLSAQELAQLVQSSGQIATASPVGNNADGSPLQAQMNLTKNQYQNGDSHLPLPHLTQPQQTTPSTQSQSSFSQSVSTPSTANTSASQAPQPAVTLKSSDVEPKLSLGVFTRRNDAVVPANTTLLSRSNPNHRLCWIAFDAVFPNQVDVEETITAPAPSQFSGATSRTISSTDGLHHSIFTTLNSANNQVVERCWQFDVNDPIGTYQISIKVGEVNYPAQKFQIVK